MSRTPPVRFVLDCDTGSDDAVALFAATAHPDLELVAVTTVNGNVGLAQTTENTLRVLDHVGSRVPVHPGADRPYARPDLPIPRDVLNRDSDFQRTYLDFPAASSSVAEGSAVSVLVDVYMKPADPDEPAPTLVATGPLTNLALALEAEPSLAARIPRLVVMGGAAYVDGNVTASAEFNFWADPEAADMVLGAGIRDVLVVPLDATHSVPLSVADCEEFDAIGTRAARGAARLIRHRLAHDQAAADTAGEVRSPVHDPLCVASLVRPDVITESARAHVSVETTGEKTLGELVVDGRPWCPEAPNATVALRAFVDVYRDFLRTAFRAGQAGELSPESRETDRPQSQGIGVPAS